MIRYDTTQVDLTSNFFILYTNVRVYLYNYSYWVELSMNSMKEKIKCRHFTTFLTENEDIKNLWDVWSFAYDRLKKKSVYSSIPQIRHR